MIINPMLQAENQMTVDEWVQVSTWLSRQLDRKNESHEHG